MSSPLNDAIISYLAHGVNHEDLLSFLSFK